MNIQMAYLLGMIAGNGEIKRGNTDTTIAIKLPHKKFETEDNHDVSVYMKASVSDIRQLIEPLIRYRY